MAYSKEVIDHYENPRNVGVLDKKYPGQVPMTPFAGMLNDEDVAAVLTYVRN